MSSTNVGGWTDGKNFLSVIVEGDGGLYAEGTEAAGYGLSWIGTIAGDTYGGGDVQFRIGTMVDGLGAGLLELLTVVVPWIAVVASVGLLTDSVIGLGGDTELHDLVTGGLTRDFDAGLTGTFGCGLAETFIGGLVWGFAGEFVGTFEGGLTVDFVDPIAPVVWVILDFAGWITVFFGGGLIVVLEDVLVVVFADGPTAAFASGLTGAFEDG